ncbi:hypothetical protein MKZ38_006865 [Zalerion maritima]|uniref:Uncharacterized protein n=1 Tax=Zalerion maritima TaxID=339359 RepID=A0AAD5RJ25_9PEZI|nr:hypothetical protein MKZ38_006865 [Zalerion maritima]
MIEQSSSQLQNAINDRRAHMDRVRANADEVGEMAAKLFKETRELKAQRDHWQTVVHMTNTEMRDVVSSQAWRMGPLLEDIAMLEDERDGLRDMTENLPDEVDELRRTIRQMKQRQESILHRARLDHQRVNEMGDLLIEAQTENSRLRRPDPHDDYFRGKRGTGKKPGDKAGEERELLVRK